MGFASSQLLAGVLTQDVEFTSSPESVRAQRVLDRAFPGAQESNDTVFFIVSSATTDTANTGFQTRVRDVEQAVAALGPDTVAVPPVSYLDALTQASWMTTPDYHGVLVALDLRGDTAATLRRVQQTVAAAVWEGFTAQTLTPPQLPLTAGAVAGDPLPSGGGGVPSGFVLVSSPTWTINDPAFASAVEAVKRAAVLGAGRSTVTPPVSAYDLRSQAASLVSNDRHFALLPATLADNEPEIVDRVRSVATQQSSDGFRVQVIGNPTLFTDFMTVADEDMRQSESIGLAVALIVLILVFAAIVAAFVPILTGMFSIAVALGLVAFIGQVVHFNLFVETMITMIGLAVGIDYSLFIVSRYREERLRGLEKLDAIARTGATASRAVFFSGMTVVLALLGMMIIPVTIFRSLAAGAILVTLAAIVASLTVLPAVLRLFGDALDWPKVWRRTRDLEKRGGFWDRVSRSVMARPVVFLVVSVLVLGTLGAFYFQLHRGTSQNISQLPNEFPSKAAFLTLDREFSGGATDPVRVVVQGDIANGQVRGAVDDLRSAIAASSAFAPDTSLLPSPDGKALVVDAYLHGDPSSDQAFAAIRNLRSRVIPAAFSDAPNVDVLVGGGTAFFTDFLDVADRYQWIVLAFVLTLSFALLTIVFRSIVVPAKAILMNLLSVAAAYGALTLVFQKGVGLGFFNSIGFHFVRVEAIEAWLPLFLFSVLFGLSMDYHVFLLSRIREEYDRTGDNTEAVAHGVRTTAGIITGAATIMVAVFVAFAMGRLGPMQQMGFGLAVAVFLDATVVRTILVPASMRLLGDLNWYLPSWLRWLPELDVEGRRATQMTPVSLEPMPATPTPTPIPRRGEPVGRR